MAKSQKKKYSGQASPSELVAGYLKRNGVYVDPLRLDEGVAAQRSRKQLENREHIANVQRLASTVKKARRATEVAEMVWRMNPTQSSQDEAMRTQRARSAAEAALLEACFNDKAQFRAALR